MNKRIRCICNNEYNEIEFNAHYNHCPNFIKQYKDFEYKISTVLKSYSKSVEDLYFIKFLFEKYINIINSELKKIGKYKKDNYIEFEDDSNKIINDPINILDIVKNDNILPPSPDLIINNCIDPSIKLITNFSFEDSYANSVFQSFSSLECIKNLHYQIKFNNFKIDSNSTLINEFLQLMDNIYNYDIIDIIDSSNYINHFNNFLLNQNTTKNIYNFLNIFLEIFHYANYKKESIIKEKFDSKKLQYKGDNSEAYNLFKQNFEKKHKSVISQNIYSINRYVVHCPNCNDMYYYDIEKIFLFDIDKYSLMNDNLSLIDCFKYNSIEADIRCMGCNKFAERYKKIFKPPKVLIIYLKRENNIYNIDFKNTIEKKDISEYICPEINNQFYYSLKACIYYDNSLHYYSDIKINNIWYRFITFGKYIIINPEEHNCQPVILFYELIEKENIQDNNQKITKY